jgi:hypothetical protein
VAGCCPPFLCPDEVNWLNSASPPCVNLTVMKEYVRSHEILCLFEAFPEATKPLKCVTNTYVNSLFLSCSSAQF